MGGFCGQRRVWKGQEGVETHQRVINDYGIARVTLGFSRATRTPGQPQLTRTRGLGYGFIRDGVTGFASYIEVQYLCNIAS